MKQDEGALSLSAVLPVFQPRRLYKQIAEALAARIRSGVFPPGAYLPSERELAAQMSVSRPSVREALIALEVMGLVVVRVGDGVQVCAPRAEPAVKDDASGATETGENSPLEQLQARILLEGEIAALAAERVTPAQEAELERALADMAAVIADRTRFLDADRRFHCAVAAASGNQTLADLLTYLWKQRSLPVYRTFEEHFTGTAEQAVVLNEHRLIVKAIRARDPEAARAAMRRHIERVRDELAL